MQSRYSWKYRLIGYARFSSLGQNKMSDYWVYDLKSCSSYMIRLDSDEAICTESRQLIDKTTFFVAFLDAKSAFDVVSHTSLLRKLFHLGIGGAEWSLVHSLHEGAESVVKWEGSISDVFHVQQGVRQGGILSTDLYNLYIDGLLDRLSSSGDECFVGEICCVAPAAGSV